MCTNPLLRTSSLAFVDDLNILVYSSSTAENCRRLERAHEKCQEWARRHGAKFSPEKYELIHFTRSRRTDLHKAVRIEGETCPPKAEVRVLGVQVDPKLLWRPHINSVKKKVTGQMRSLTAITGSTWGTCFAWARRIYTAVVRPTMTYAAPVWYATTSTGKGKKWMQRELAKIQNEGLRRVLGAYRATSIPVLENEAQVPPIELVLDKTVLDHQRRQQGTTGQQTVENFCRRIRNNLQRRQRQRPNTLERPNHQPGQGENTWRTLQEKWKQKWESYRRAHVDGPPATADLKAKEILKMRSQLPRRETTMATLVRSECIGLRAFLHKRRVPGFDNPACDCGGGRQTAKHTIMFCTKWDRAALFEGAGSQDYRKMVSTARGIRAITRWMISCGILEQFNLYRYQ